MNKKPLFIFLIITTLIIGFIIFIRYKNTKIVSPVNQKELNVAKENPVINKEFIDPAGFKFSYPNNIKVEKDELENDDLYSSLSLTSDETTGSIKLTAESSNLTKIEDWFNNSEIDLKKAKKIKFADLNAYEFEQDRKKTLVALDQRVLFTITNAPTSDENYWNKVYEGVIKTFAFVQPENSSTASQTSSSGESADDVVFEGEEVVE